VLRKLFENGFDYVKVAKEGGGSGGGGSMGVLGSVRDDEVMLYFDGFYPDKVRFFSLFFVFFFVLCIWGK
jgi:hypothetical protein